MSDWDGLADLAVFGCKGAGLDGARPGKLGLEEMASVVMGV